MRLHEFVGRDGSDRGRQQIDTNILSWRRVSPELMESPHSPTAPRPAMKTWTGDVLDLPITEIAESRRGVVFVQGGRRLGTQCCSRSSLPQRRLVLIHSRRGGDLFRMQSNMRSPLVWKVLMIMFLWKRFRPRLPNCLYRIWHRD